ncbi:MAG: hypothetical protein R3C03_15890 [Pirellulaceae bacterium]
MVKTIDDHATPFAAKDRCVAVFFTQFVSGFDGRRRDDLFGTIDEPPK